MPAALALLLPLSFLLPLPCSARPAFSQKAPAALAGASAASPSFTLAWKHVLEDPYEPMAMAVVAHADTVVVGLRDCPLNSENELLYLSLASGAVAHKVAQTNGTSEIAVAHRGKEVIVYGIGWVKTDKTMVEKTYLSASVGSTPDSFHQWSSLFKGEGSTWGSSAVSSSGDLGALLLEPTPSMKNMNNRSAVLMLFGPSSPTPLYTYEVDGLGSTDPQTVAVSAHATAAGVYTVAAIMGFVTVVFDYDMAAGKATQVYKLVNDDGNQDEMVIAVSPNGQQFAVSTEVGVDVFHRNTKGIFAKIGFEGIKSPVTDQAAQSISFAEEAAAGTGDNTLAIGWCGAQGESTGASLHTVAKGGIVKKEWSHHQNCGGFDEVVDNGIAVTAKGDWVVIGKWGCGDGVQRLKNIAVFQGIGGDGVPVFQAETAGEVWSVDIDVAGNGTVIVGAAAWAVNGNRMDNTSIAAKSSGHESAAASAAQVYIWSSA